MRKLIFVIAVAMMFFAVEGYAQRTHGGGVYSQSRSTRLKSSDGSQRNSSFASQANYGVRPRKIVDSKEDIYRKRKGHNGNISPYRDPIKQHPNTHYQGGYNSQDNHHVFGYRKPHFSHVSKHYQYKSNFDVWMWVSFMNYHRRFICDSRYANRYFDTVLGYYIYGALDAPSELVIGKLSLSRYNNFLSVISDGRARSYNVYNSHRLNYVVGYKNVDILIKNGIVVITIFDELGNSATYYM